MLVRLVSLPIGGWRTTGTAQTHSARSRIKEAREGLEDGGGREGKGEEKGEEEQRGRDGRRGGRRGKKGERR